MIVEILHANNLTLAHYCEPYAGGCGLALALLFGGDVSDVHVNDLDPAVWAFWDTVLNRSQDLADLIEATPVTVDEWHHQREIFLDQDLNDPVRLGFAMFFLNRTNRSGVIKSAGVIGGIDQTGKYKIDCRFNKPELIRRIRRIAKYRSRIHLYNEDAAQLMCRSRSLLPAKSFFCIDPPYFHKGSKLYKNFYNRNDHEAIARIIRKLKHPWIVTYDKVDDIRALYSAHRAFPFHLNYSLQTKRIGTELLIPSKGLRLTRDVRARFASE